MAAAGGGGWPMRPRARPQKQALPAGCHPQPGVGRDRIDAVPFRKLVVIEREISVAGQRFDGLEIQAGADLVVDIQITDWSVYELWLPINVSFTPFSASNFSKYAMVRIKPSFNCMRGFHANNSCAREISGRRWRGSSCGNGR